MKLDYTLESPEDRKAYVEKLLEENPELPSRYLDYFADYILMAIDKQERKQRKILTENRLSTINKRETSYEGLALSLENGEDGIYNLTCENKNALLQPKISITAKDLAKIPYLAQLRETIEKLEEKSKCVEGRDAYIIKKMLIDLRKDQYIIKNAYRQPVQNGFSLSSKPIRHLDENTYLSSNGEIIAEGINFCNPKIIEEILANYSHLKEDSHDRFLDDTWYMMQDFDELCGRALKEEPMLERLVELKIDGRQNTDIQKILEEEFSAKYSAEYISSLWRKKIPKLIATEAQKEWLDYHFTEEEKGHWKRCSRCKEVKLAHNLYFSKNSTSKDGFYSLCKECRNKKKDKTP